MNTQHDKFISLIEKHKRLICKVCYVYTNSQDDFNDYYQESLLNLWKAFSSFRGDCQEQTWIYRIVLNTCISYIRKGNNSFKTVPLPEDINLYDDTEEYSQIQELYQLFNKLNDFDKAIIFLYLEDKSYEEIGIIIGISTSNVGVRINRIKEKLKKMSNQ